MMRSISFGLHPGIRECGLGCLDAEQRGRLVVRRDMALLDACALDDPLVRGFHQRLEIPVGDDPFRQI